MQAEGVVDVSSRDEIVWVQNDVSHLRALAGVQRRLFGSEQKSGCLGDVVIGSKTEEAANSNVPGETSSPTAEFRGSFVGNRRSAG